MSIRTVVRSVGHALPARVVTNKDLEEFIDTHDEWIVQRTGIRERRVAAPDETSASLASLAAQEALARAGLAAADLDLIILATISGDYIWPSSACLVQEMIGAKNAAAFDLSAACAGFIFGLATADGLIQSGQMRNALVLGADTLTKQMDWTDRGTAILFGDGAAGVLVSAEQGGDRGVLQTVLCSDGGGARHIILPGGGTRTPFGAEGVPDREYKLKMSGKEVYRFAVQAMGDACQKVLDKAGMTSADVDLFVPHQANLRIIDSAAERLGLTQDRVFVNVDRYGNTSGASVPLGLYEAETSGRLQPGMVVMTVGFGAGLVWGANLIRW